VQCKEQFSQELSIRVKFVIFNNIPKLVLMLLLATLSHHEFLFIASAAVTSHHSKSHFATRFNLNSNGHKINLLCGVLFPFFFTTSALPTQTVGPCPRLAKVN
jgi:hypothetical protein